MFNYSIKFWCSEIQVCFYLLVHLDCFFMSLQNSPALETPKDVLTVDVSPYQSNGLDIHQLKSHVWEQSISNSCCSFRECCSKTKGEFHVIHVLISSSTLLPPQVEFSSFSSLKCLLKRATCFSKN